MKTIQIKEIKKYQTEDGSVFDTQKEAEEYVQLTSTDLYKSLVERVQKLEQELIALKTEVSTKSWFRDVQINKPPFQQPMYSEPLPNYTVMNPAKKENCKGWQNKGYKMKYIWLGIKDYCKDCWHDFLLRNLQKHYKGRPIKFISIATDRLLDMGFWKDGNLRHYIQQRRIAKRKGNDNQCKTASLDAR